MKIARPFITLAPTALERILAARGMSDDDAELGFSSEPPRASDGDCGHFVEPRHRHGEWLYLRDNTVHTVLARRRTWWSTGEYCWASNAMLPVETKKGPSGCCEASMELQRLLIVLRGVDDGGREAKITPDPEHEGVDSAVAQVYCGNSEADGRPVLSQP